MGAHPALAAAYFQRGSGEVKNQIRSGKKLLFKPNLVAPGGYISCDSWRGLGTPVVAEWPFPAALMRWFHDKLDISYHQMAQRYCSPALEFPLKFS